MLRGGLDLSRWETWGSRDPLLNEYTRFGPCGLLLFQVFVQSFKSCSPSGFPWKFHLSHIITPVAIFPSNRFQFSPRQFLIPKTTTTTTNGSYIDILIYFRWKKKFVNLPFVELPKPEWSPRSEMNRASRRIHYSCRINNNIWVNAEMTLAEITGTREVGDDAGSSLGRNWIGCRSTL